MTGHEFTPFQPAKYRKQNDETTACIRINRTAGVVRFSSWKKLRASLWLRVERFSLESVFKCLGSLIYIRPTFTCMYKTVHSSRRDSRSRIEKTTLCKRIFVEKILESVTPLEFYGRILLLHLSSALGRWSSLFTPFTPFREFFTFIVGRWLNAFLRVNEFRFVISGPLLLYISL